MTEQVVENYERAPARRPHLHRWRRHRQERAAPGKAGLQRGDAAQDHRQRHRRDRHHASASRRPRDRDRGHRPGAQHRAQPPPDHPHRGDGPPGRLADPGRGPRRRRRRDPDPGDPVPHRERRRRRSSRRTTSGTNFRVVAVAEGAQDVETNRRLPGHGRPAQVGCLREPGAGGGRRGAGGRSTPITPGTPSGSRASSRRSRAWSHG